MRRVSGWDQPIWSAGNTPQLLGEGLEVSAEVRPAVRPRQVRPEPGGMADDTS